MRATRTLVLKLRRFLPPRMDVVVHPVTPERWSDLERLFGPNGAYSNCWCAFFRLKRTEFEAASPAKKKGVLRSAVKGGEAPGVLAYVDGEPAAWAAVAPREATPVLQRSGKRRAADPEGVWAVTCFFVHKEHRRQGLMTKLVDAAVAHARAGGARALDAFPVEPGEDLAGCEGYTGVSTVFRRAGFRAVRGRPGMVRLAFD